MSVASRAMTKRVPTSLRARSTAVARSGAVRRWMGRAGAAGALGAFVSACTPAQPPFTQAQVLGGVRVGPQVLERGRALFNTHCVACHGARGEGDGPASRSTPRAPRSFVAADFSHGSGEPGSLPSHDELVAVIRNGVPSAGMPPWFQLSGSDLDAVANYIKTFSPRWAEITLSKADPVDPDPVR